jgi:hypothetical protein
MTTSTRTGVRTITMINIPLVEAFLRRCATELDVQAALCTQLAIAQRLPAGPHQTRTALRRYDRLVGNLLDTESNLTTGAITARNFSRGRLTTAAPSLVTLVNLARRLPNLFPADSLPSQEYLDGQMSAYYTHRRTSN